MKLSFNDITAFLLPNPGDSVSLGGVTFENIACGIVYSHSVDEWDRAAVLADANAILAPRWEEFVSFVQSRNAAGVIRPHTVEP